MIRAPSGLLAFLIALPILSGCDRSVAPFPEGALIVTQVPAATRPGPSPASALDLRYPAGSRVAFVLDRRHPDHAIVLSRGLHAAGSPVLSPDGNSVLFVGRESPSAPWQIYLVALRGGAPRRLTDRADGAFDPTWLPNGHFAFSSAIPEIVPSLPTERRHPPALFSQAITGGPPTRLTFGLAAATDALTLPDGRLLFVSAVVDDAAASPRAPSFFTINNDGTEVSPFAAQHDGPAMLRRPRLLPDGRLVFVAAGVGTPGFEGRIEQVTMSQPYRSRSIVFPPLAEPCRSIEADGPTHVLATLGSSATGTYAVYRLGREFTQLGDPVFDDPAWHDVEALPATLPPPSMGRLSTVDPSRRSGLLLVLDANHTDRPDSPAGTRLRVVRHQPDRCPTVLGETPLQTDGSSLVEVPADVPLAFQVLRADGMVLRSCPPGVWVRPGENRACVGCHEPHNRAPANRRPRAVQQPPVSLLPATADSTGEPSSR